MNQVQIQIEKPVAANVSAVASLAFVLMARPGSGAALFSHTFAAFSLLGLFAGKKVSRQTMLRVWGQRAITWHHDSAAEKDPATGVVQSDKFTHDDKGYALTQYGRDFFKDIRKVDPELVTTFTDLLSKGKTERACAQSYKMTKPL